jgi:hypothetical protein
MSDAAGKLHTTKKELHALLRGLGLVRPSQTLIHLIGLESRATEQQQLELQEIM